jgi:hypothetical protein
LKLRRLAAISNIESPHAKYIYGVGLALIILFTVFVRFRLLEIPLERDEGSFAYMGQLILHGIPPYLLSYSLKLPGIFATYALIMFLFGQTISGIHLGLLIVNSITIILVYLIASLLFDRFAGLIAAGSFAILSLSPTVYGTQAHATHFVILLALAGLLLMLKFIELDRKGYIFWSGLLLGLAFLMKQHAIFFIIFASIYLFFNIALRQGYSYLKSLKVEALFWMGAFIPFAITCGVLYLTGAFEKFWFWTFTIASQTASHSTFSQGIITFLMGFRFVTDKLYFFWWIAILGIAILLINKTYRNRALFVLGFLIFSFISICPSFYFFPHYFILLLPAVSLLNGICFSGLRRYFVSIQPRFRSIPLILFAIIFFLAVFEYREYFFRLTPLQACRSTYETMPFIEVINIAEYIESHTSENDTIAVLGSEPEIFFYSNRRSATAYTETYTLIQDQKYALQMQQEMIKELEIAKPKYIVFVSPLTNSWLSFPDRSSPHKIILEWARVNIKRNYDLEGVVDIPSANYTEYRWGDDAQKYMIQSPNFILIFKLKRKTDTTLFNRGVS